MRRILNSFLQFVEEGNSTDSVIIAATNHPELLDRALGRRFDEVIAYDMPDEAAARQVIERHLGSFRPRQVQWVKVPAAAHLSHAEIARAVDDVIKRAIIGVASKASSAQLVAALQERQEAKDAILGKREA